MSEQTLQLKVVATGIQQIQQQFGGMASGLRSVLSGALAGAVTEGLRQLANFSLSEAMDAENTVASLRGLNQTLSQTKAVMDQIARSASEGVFSEDELNKAAISLAKWGGELRKDLEIAKRIGAISGVGGLEKAAELIGMVRGGQTERLTLKLKEFGFGPEKLASAGIDPKTASTEQWLAGLEKLSKSTNSYEERMKTTTAAMNSLRQEFAEFAEDLGKDLLPLVKQLGAFFKDAVKGLRALNDALGGKLSWILGVGMVAAAGATVASLWNLVANVNAAALAIKGGAVAGAASGAAGAAGGGLGGLATGFVSGLFGKILLAVGVAVASYKLTEGLLDALGYHKYIEGMYDDAYSKAEKDINAQYQSPYKIGANGRLERREGYGGHSPGRAARAEAQNYGYRTARGM
jgi:hypothetical protein